VESNNFGKKFERERKEKEGAMVKQNYYQDTGLLVTEKKLRRKKRQRLSFSLINETTRREKYRQQDRNKKN